LKLEPGHQKTITLTIEGKLDVFAAGGVQWDAGDLAVGDQVPEGDKGNGAIYRLRVSGSKAVVGGVTQLSGNPYGSNFTDFWIQGSEVITSMQENSVYHGWVKFWAYPTGGHALKGLKGTFGEPFGVVVSPGR
jgi:hypothetical protein